MVPADDTKFQEFRVKMNDTVTFKESPVMKPEVFTPETVRVRVKREQITQMFIPKMKELNLGQRYELYVYDKTKSTTLPRYTLTVIDSNDAKILKKRTCGAFITPQGKERDSMISTEVGKFQLSAQAGYSRLIIITLSHGHKFDSIETVKNELSPKVIELAPKNCSNYKEIPFLTIGTDIGERHEVFRTDDGSIFIEDLKDNEGNVYRQAMFSSKPEQIQSEVLLVYRNSKKGSIPENLKTTSHIAPKKKQRQLVYNNEILCCEYQYAMLAGISTVAEKLLTKDKIRVLQLGTGCGLFPMFLRGQFGDKLHSLVTVDINEQMIKIAKEYFGFQEDEKVKSVIADAYKYVDEITSGEKFDIVVMDINYEEDNISLSPPKKFLEREFLAKLINLTTEEGFVTFNLLSQDTQLLNSVYSDVLSTSALGKYIIEGEEDANKVIVLTKSEAVTEDQRHTAMDKFIKEYGINRGVWLTEMRIKQKIDQIQDVKAI